MPEARPMSGFLDANEIEKLFARASEGNAPVEAGERQGRRARWLRTVDFTRPTKFSTDQERRIRRAMDTFTERVATRLVAEHRTPIELEVIDVGQFTWANAFAQVPDGSVHIQIDTGPHEGRMLLSAELPVVLVSLERMLGGRPETASRDRELTDIDLMVVHRLFGTIVETLSAVWFDVAEMTLEVGSVDTQAETIQVAAGSEPTLALTLEARLDGLSSTMTLLVPYAAIAPVASAFSRHDEAEHARDERVAAAVNHGLSLVDVSLRAEVADCHLTLAEVLALAPGDVVRLDADAESEVTLYADRTPIHHARGGRSGNRRAVQIVAPVEIAP
jgi:flagellar motor switch protein FliM